ncbi:MAG TPA: tagatose 1,6-diphosphate aldolase [Anaerolineaceae bacterium]
MEKLQGKLSKGKIDGINAIADKNGVIAALAMDQRGSLQKSIAKARGGEASADDLREFKQIISEVLTPYASAILLDPEFGLDAVRHRDPKAGVLLAYEKTGYDATVKGRLPDLIPEWSVQRLVAAGAHAIKFLIYYDPDDDPKILTVKHAFIERIGAECRANEVPFFLEIVVYSDAIPDEKSLEFARVKPGKVGRAMQELSQTQYGVDVLKVEAPVNMRFVEGSAANPDGQNAYSRAEAKAHFSATAAASRLPFIYLSAGVSNAVFLETLALAGESGAPFSGVLCGRATWQDGIPLYAKGGAKALRAWLMEKGVENIQELNRTLVQQARPWWDFYGGKDNLGG